MQADGPTLIPFTVNCTQQELTLTVTGGAHPQEDVHYFGALQIDAPPAAPTNPAPGPLGSAGMLIHLKGANARAVGIVAANNQGQSQRVIPAAAVPPQISGRTAYFQAVSVDGTANPAGWLLSEPDACVLP